MQVLRKEIVVVHSEQQRGRRAQRHVQRPERGERERELIAREVELIARVLGEFGQKI